MRDFFLPKIHTNLRKETEVKLSQTKKFLLTRETLFPLDYANNSAKLKAYGNMINRVSQIKDIWLHMINRSGVFATVGKQK